MASGKLSGIRLSATLALGLLCAAGDSARADASSVKGEVLVVLAKEEAGPVEPRLRDVAALRKPPFNVFKSLALLSTSAIELGDGQPVFTDLPNGRRLQISLLERMSDGRHKVQVSINRPDKKDYLPLLTVIASGEPFFVAGQKHAGGTLVIGVRIGEPRAQPTAAPGTRP